MYKEFMDWWSAKNTYVDCSNGYASKAVNEPFYESIWHEATKYPNSKIDSALRVLKGEGGPADRIQAAVSILEG